MDCCYCLDGGNLDELRDDQDLYNTSSLLKRETVHSLQKAGLIVEVSVSDWTASLQGTCANFFNR